MLSNVSKMPGKSISLSAFDCQTGEKLSKIPGSVCHDCYARKGMYRMPNVINKMLNKTRSEYFRWFDSGDVQSVRMALNILDVVEATPGKRHWIPTKERAIWLEAIKQYGRKLPDNLVIRYSATMVNHAPPKSWQHSSAVVNKSAYVIGHECPAPKQQGKCGDCRACWDTNVKTVSYHKH
jgi:hypothetical protein